MEKQYKIEAHLHTAETSPCGFISAVDFVDMYHALGYDGIFVTDHLHEGFISSLDCKDDWNACIDCFLAGYKKALEHGRQTGLNVMLGAEIRFTGPNDSDYLIYGFDEDFLRKNPYLHRLNPQEFFRRYGDEILIINAHPYRNGNEVVFVDCIHGIEVYNSMGRHNNFNEKALALSKKHPELYLFAGSDAHQKGDEAGAWMLFKEPIANSREFHEAVKRNEYLISQSPVTTN